MDECERKPTAGCTERPEQELEQELRKDPHDLDKKADVGSDQR